VCSGANSAAPTIAKVPDLSPALIARAHAYVRGESEVVTARHAATVVLLRDGASGPEAYLLHRVSTMAFAAGMVVFPGGRVDARDSDAAVGWSGPSPVEWAERLGCDPPLARALVCAAVRETFEESGVLLAGASGEDVVPDTTGVQWENDRTALVERELGFAELLSRRRLVLRSDLMTAWAHWVTPEFEPRRYDTRFFVAALPEGQRARDVGGEAAQVTWMPVRDAVLGYQRGDLAMLPPTVSTLRELSGFDSVAAALCSRQQITPVMPRPVLDDGGLSLVVDGPAGEVPADSFVRSQT
jgi:8-oxo-dGTP pyrophosphatase MutT (NUDIX family)